MIPEIDIWRAAQLMLNRYGDNALAESMVPPTSSLPPMIGQRAGAAVAGWPYSRATASPRASCEAIPNRACLRGSRRAPIDAGLANASDTSYIYEVLDSHPSFPISQPQSRPVGRKVAAHHYGLGVISRSVAGG